MFVNDQAKNKELITKPMTSIRFFFMRRAWNVSCGRTDIQKDDILPVRI